MRTPVEQVFSWLDERAKNLEGVDYLEQFIQSLQEIEESDIGPVFQDLSKEQLRKVYQFILIKPQINVVIILVPIAIFGL